MGRRFCFNRQDAKSAKIGRENHRGTKLHREAEEFLAFEFCSVLLCASVVNPSNPLGIMAVRSLFHSGIVFMRVPLTHAEYSKGTWKDRH